MQEHKNHSQVEVVLKVYYRAYWLRQLITSGGSDSKPESWAKPII